MCQAFYNPVLTSALELLVSAGDGTEAEEFVVSGTDSKVGATPPELKNIQRCALLQMDLPDGFEGMVIRGSSTYCCVDRFTWCGGCMFVCPPVHVLGKSFGELFHHLCIHQGVIAIGLYRGVWDRLGHGPYGNHMPFVQTCPAADAELHTYAGSVDAPSPHAAGCSLTRVWHCAWFGCTPLCLAASTRCSC